MDFAVLGTVRVNGPGGRVRLSGRQRAVVSAMLTSLSRSTPGSHPAR
ncbi:hypothetical protein AB0L05_15130 [Nonomuraea pusilla]